MLLTGSSQRSIDEKQRVAIPKRFRDVIAKSSATPGMLFLTPGTDGSLNMYTDETLSSLADQLAVASPAGQDVRAFSRLFFSRAESADIDSQGRVRIPQELAKHADLSKEAMLVGVRDHLELWDLARWNRYVEKLEQSYDELAERAFARP